MSDRPRHGAVARARTVTRAVTHASVTLGLNGG